MLASVTKRGLIRCILIAALEDEGKTASGWSWQLDPTASHICWRKRRCFSRDIWIQYTPATYVPQSGIQQCSPYLANIPFSSPVRTAPQRPPALGPFSRRQSRLAGGRSYWRACRTYLSARLIAIRSRRRKEQEGLGLGEPWQVASTGQRTSVYAMAVAPSTSAIPSFLLFVGFFDGVVRVYDTRQITSLPEVDNEGNEDGMKAYDMQSLHHALDESTDQLHFSRRINRRRRRIKKELNPIAVFREDFDMTPSTACPSPVLHQRYSSLAGRDTLKLECSTLACCRITTFRCCPPLHQHHQQRRERMGQCKRGRGVEIGQRSHFPIRIVRCMGW